jgi:Arc/MetJ-type ribon-helix-helix transcriptional regulator
MNENKDNVLIQAMIPHGDYEQVVRIMLFTKRYLNRSDFLRTAVRKLIEEEQKNAEIMEL